VSWEAAAGLRLPEMTVEILTSLGEHRILSTAQVQAIHFPTRSLRRTQQALAYLTRAGLIAYAEARRAPRRLYFLTERGAELALLAGEVERRPKVLAPEQAAGLGYRSLPARASDSRSSSVPSRQEGRCVLTPSALMRSASASCGRRGRGATNSARSPGAMRSRTPSIVAAVALAGC
jgi:hypothetical protein